MTAKRSKPATPPEIISKWEWITGALGLALVTFVLVVLVREARAGTSPPDLRVGIDSITAQPGAFIAHITVRNDGGAPAAAVEVEGELPVTGGEPHRAAVTLAHVPPRSSKSGGLLFASDPRRGRLVVRVLGFADP